MRTPRAIGVGVLGALMVLACAGASGCLRESTGCVDDSECGAGLVCTGGVCALPATPDVGGGDAGGLDTGRPDGGAEDAGPPDASEDVGADTDAGGEDPRWQVLASDSFDATISSALLADGGLAVVYPAMAGEVFEVVRRRADGVLLSPDRVPGAPEILFDLFAFVSDGLELVFTTGTSELVSMRADEPDAGQVSVLLPQDEARLGVLKNRVVSLGGGRVVGGLVSLVMAEGAEVTRVEWLDTSSPGLVETMDEEVFDEASYRPDAVTVRRGDGFVVFWHLDVGAIEYATVDGTGQISPGETLDQATAQELEGEDDALGFSLVAHVDEQSTAWVAYLIGDVNVNGVRVRGVTASGDVLALPQLTLEPFRGVLDLSVVVSGGEVHVVYQELNSRDQVDSTSSLVHARHDSAGWTRTTLDPQTGRSRFVEAHMGEGGMHVVYTAFTPEQGFSGEVRYQWVAF